MLSNKKKLQYITIFILLLLLTFYLLLKDYSLDRLAEIIKNINYSYFILGLGLAFIYIICESFAFRIIFANLKEKRPLLSLIRYSFIGFYFSAITPSATGGQPMQMYYMKKDKIALSKSSLAMMLCVMSYQISLILLFIVSLSFNSQLVFNQSKNLHILFIIACIFNFTFLAFILAAIFSKKFLMKIINFIFNRILVKIKFIKNQNDKKIAVINIIEDYRNSSKLFKKNPFVLAKIISIYIFQLIVRFSITYVAALAINIDANNILLFIGLQSIVLFCVSSLPIPGGVGISETLYISLFAMLIPKDMINTAALTSQLLTYYIPVIAGALIVLYSQIKYGQK